MPQASAMIRRLVEELDKKPKPLNDEEIYDLWCDADNKEALRWQLEAAKMLLQQQAEIEALKSLFRQLKIEPNLPDAWRKLGEMLDE